MDKQDVPGLVELDGALMPYRAEIEERRKHFYDVAERLAGGVKGLAELADGYLWYGLHKKKGGWVFREWAPAAKAIYLFGDFNGWQREAAPLERLENGDWQIELPKDRLKHGDKLRLLVDTGTEKLERVPLYAKRVVQNPETLSYDAEVWQPVRAYRWRHGFTWQEEKPPLIYECHVGMSAENKGIASFEDFTNNVLPRALEGGYTAIQLMAVMEHPYYGSFGYQVSSFFAVSSRFGTPDDLKRLVDAAHGMGLGVILDVVHAHMAANEVEGIARFDGSYTQFSKPGIEGQHPEWGTRVFDYGKDGVLHFLLSNLKYWLEEYRFDGLRFDGVTSMLYKDHGAGRGFGGYGDYFSPMVDTDGVCYLQLATTLCRALLPEVLLIAEDVSGMPGLCRPVEEGGIGFSHRLNMGAPDLWARLLHLRDEEWSMEEIWETLAAKRPGEARIGYCESHDQALVGEQTLMFRLAGEEMYWYMNRTSDSVVIERAIALHKVIRLLTFALGGEGWLAFMGNEFGHPDWIDFPREGNGYSYQYAQRQWSLAENPFLRYHDLLEFDREMLKLAHQWPFLQGEAELLVTDEESKSLVFSRGGLLFLFNLHPARDMTCSFKRGHLGEWGLVLNTNWEGFGGFREDGQDTQEKAGDQIDIWLDRRSAAVYKTGVQ